MVVNSLLENELRGDFRIIQRERINYEANSSVIVPPTAETDPKQRGRLPIVVMSCPLLLARQHDPNAPAVFVLHSFSNVSLRVPRSSPDAQAESVARTRRDDM